MQLDWHKCEGNVWCELNKVDLDHQYLKGLEGIFIIWAGKSPKTVLYAGSGNISDELKKLKKDIAIQAFAPHGLYATWTEVPGSRQDAVLSYIHTQLNPKMSSRKDFGGPTRKVNLPW